MPCVCELKIIMRSNAIFWIFSKLWPRTFETQAVVLRLDASLNCCRRKHFNTAVFPFCVGFTCVRFWSLEAACLHTAQCILHISITHYTLNLSQICIAHIVPPSMQVHKIMSMHKSTQKCLQAHKIVQRGIKAQKIVQNCIKLHSIVFTSLGAAKPWPRQCVLSQESGWVVTGESKTNMK